jgi:hypothetical protein
MVVEWEMVVGMAMLLEIGLDFEAIVVGTRGKRFWFDSFGSVDCPLETILKRLISILEKKCMDRVFLKIKYVKLILLIDLLNVSQIIKR